MYLSVDQGFFILPLFLWSIALRPPVGWMPLTDTADKRTSVCVLEGVLTYMALMFPAILLTYEAFIHSSNNADIV